MPIAIVVPCYNEQQRLPLSKLKEWIAGHGEIHWCFVNDGSTDGTLDMVAGLQRQFPDQVAVVELDQNSGKAEAVRRGVLAMAESGNYGAIGFTDADFATPLGEVLRCTQAMSADATVAVLAGSRLRGGDIQRSWRRHMMGKTMAMITRYLFLRIAKLSDPSCGMKIFRKDVIQTTFAAPFHSRWLFDLELFIRIRKAGVIGPQAQVVDFPLRKWTEMAGSKIDGGPVLGLPRELWQIYKAYQ